MGVQILAGEPKKTTSNAGTQFLKVTVRPATVDQLGDSAIAEAYVRTKPQLKNILDVGRNREELTAEGPLSKRRPLLPGAWRWCETLRGIENSNHA